MVVLLILILVAAAAYVARRFVVANRGQRLPEPPQRDAPDPRTGLLGGPQPAPPAQPEASQPNRLPLSPRSQVRRAMLAAQGTRVRPGYRVGRWQRKRD